MADNPKIRQKAERAKLPTLPAPFEGNVLNRRPPYQSGSVAPRVSEASNPQHIATSSHKDYDLIGLQTLSRRLTTLIGGSHLRGGRSRRGARRSAPTKGMPRTDPFFMSLLNVQLLREFCTIA